MQLTGDYHVHSNYSDGRPLPAMLAAAADAGLEAVGIADHCNVSDRARPGRARRRYGFNLDLTYERRREALSGLAESVDLAVHDGVELDYDPRDEAEIERFLATADFDYAIGSVHALDGTNVFDRAHFEATSERERADLVDDYYERLVSLIESGLFEVVGHVDVIERTPPLRGHTTRAHREAVADALASSPTLPEVNAGRLLGEYGRIHPRPGFVDALRERDVRFVPGTDSHRPDELRDRVPALLDRFADLGLEPAAPFDAG